MFKSHKISILDVKHTISTSPSMMVLIGVVALMLLQSNKKNGRMDRYPKQN